MSPRSKICFRQNYECRFVWISLRSVLDFKLRRSLLCILRSTTATSTRTPSINSFKIVQVKTIHNHRKDYFLLNQHYSFYKNKCFFKSWNLKIKFWIFIIFHLLSSRELQNCKIHALKQRKIKSHCGIKCMTFLCLVHAYSLPFPL